MEIDTFLSLISSFRRSSMELKDFFSLLYKNNIVSSEGNIFEISENNKLKICYMMVAMIISDWESLENILLNEYSKLHNMIYKKEDGTSRKYLNDEVKKVADIRHCIMHHAGRLDTYLARHSDITIDRKYVSNKNNIEIINLTYSDILDFLQIISKAYDEIVSLFVELTAVV